MSKKFAYKVLKVWLPIAVAVTLMCCTVYLTMQQTYRMDANDPQIQYVEDIRNALEEGTTPEQIIGQSTVDISKSLNPFIIIYSSNKDITASSAILEGGTPSIPGGVLDEVAKKGAERVTWQPQKGVRAALVVVKYKDGYVVAGRNLREVESRIEKQGLGLVFAWALTLAATLFTVVAARIINKKLEV